MPFSPIAIVGRGCVLPDALDPESFWENILARRVSLSAAPAGRWRLTGEDPPAVSCDVGGYVAGFDEAFDPEGFLVDAERILGLDPVFHYVLYGARQALREAGVREPHPRAGLVLGNLSLPSEGMAAFAEGVWRSAPDRPGPLNRFSSGLPAHLAARALGLGGGAFALDAACASSLYAIKLACDRLQEGTADLMVAGAVNRSDDLALHLKFSALGALSPTGRSRPFDSQADGLVPAEGAAFVTLMRLADAVAADARVLGVIRGIGLSNDGRGAGLLVPSEPGQTRALRRAYESARITPGEVSLLECHATGTPVGDAAEIRSTARVFAGARSVPVGSVKSNLGHLLTAAGATGVIKVLEAMRAGIRPPTLGVDEPVALLGGTPLRLLRTAEEWDGPRLAGVSAFGFGGNNAHIVIEEWTGDTCGAVEPPLPSPPPAPPHASAEQEIAVVAIGARVGDCADFDEFRDALLGGVRRQDPATHYQVPLRHLRFPPADLQRTLGQQVSVLEAAREAVRDMDLPRERTMVVIGMGCDAEAARHSARSRADGPLRDAIAPALTAPDVVGLLPNVVANRISSHLDVTGPSFTVSAEEASGLVALELGARALRDGEADAVLAGAVDLSHEPVHRRALAEIGMDSAPGDAAVVFVLKRLTDARRDGDQVIAVLTADVQVEPSLVVGDAAADVPGAVDRFDPADLFGVPHAAKGLLAAACAAVALRYGATPRADRPADPDLARGSATVAVHVLEGGRGTVTLRAEEVVPWTAERPPELHVFSGAGLPEVLAAARAGRASDTGPARLVVLAQDAEQLTARIRGAERWLTQAGPAPVGVAYRERPVTGEVAFVFTNGAASYPRMGRDLMLAFPGAVDDLQRRCGPLKDLMSWAYSDDDRARGQALDKILAASALGHLHADITRGVLGLEPTAVLGYSSGEPSGLVAMGAWPDAAGLVADTRGSALFTSALTGEMTAIREAWSVHGHADGRWESYAVIATADAVRAAVESEPAVHVMGVNAPTVNVIGGESTGCRRVLARLGAPEAVLLDYDIAVHVPEAELVREECWELHHRPTSEVPGVRFYSAVDGRAYQADAVSAADAVTSQMMGTIDFVATVERAWQDGVRVFVEHGPQSLCTGWIKRILGDREHLAVALDAGDERGVRQLTRAVAELVAAGVPVRGAELLDGLARHRSEPEGTATTVRVAAHFEPVRLPAAAPAPAPGREPAPPPAPVPVPASPSLPETEVQIMAPPPEPSAVLLPQPIPLPPQPVPSTPPVSEAPSPNGHPAASPLSGIAAAHEAFLATQSRAHARYLRHTERISGLVRSRRAVGPSVRAEGGGRTATPYPPAGWNQDANGPAPRETETETAGGPGAGAGTAPGTPARQAPLPAPTGPRFNRAQLEQLSSGRISEVFGPIFRAQDDFPRQVRMPRPPLLLADRVTGIDAVPGELGTGTIWTETDVTAEAWYLDPVGRMPAGLMVESGQADLLLVSWMGVDLLNRSERVYRLLGCELTFHGPRCVPGETLAFGIHIDEHGGHVEQRLFFFHYDCHVGGELRLSVRGGQAGFFTDAELAAAGGILWDPREETPAPGRRVDPPAVPVTARRFTADEVRAFAEGRPADCFGPQWRITRAHVRPPRTAEGRLSLISEVAEFDPSGGPWQRGYLRAVSPVSPDDWFFEGHFKGDPCMPGTLMFEGGLQAMAFYLAAMGHTLDNDGWRFEPVTGQPMRMTCRGQVTPASRELVYEVFVTEVASGPEPTLTADVLCTVDGVKAFLAKDVGLRLVPDWPLATCPETPSAARGLLASALGRPSDAFGPLYEPFDGVRRASRLPAPPYLFVSRVLSVDAPPGEMTVDSHLVAEYDVPVDAWYWQEGGHRVMPLAVLMEVALQPCGWLASHVGCALASDEDTLFRNLDGSGTVLGEVTPSVRTVRTEVTLRDISHHDGMTIVSFDVASQADGVPVLSASTVFGYFPRAAFAEQTGLPGPAEPDGPSVDSVGIPAGLACPELLMLDRITGYWPHGGRAGLGRVLAEKDIDPGEWFFKAHFFQDPVQPGSLGVQAMCQLLQAYLIERGLGAGTAAPRFQQVAVGQSLTWRYRGQVTPENRKVTVELEVLRVEPEDDGGVLAVADAWLWADGTRVYHVPELAMRMLPPDPDPDRPLTVPLAVPHVVEEILDPATDSWLADHRPTWTVPVLPMMSMADRMVAAVRSSGREVPGLRDLRIRRWLAVPGPTRLRTEVTEDSGGLEVTLLQLREARHSGLSRFEPVATARVAEPADRPPVWPEPDDAVEMESPYVSGAVMHGRAFHHLRSLRVGPSGSVAVLDAGAGTVPYGTLHQGLLDGLTHVVPHNDLGRWSPGIGRDVVGFPLRMDFVRFHERLPAEGEVRVLARFAGFPDGDRAHPAFDIQVSRNGRVLVSLRLVDVLVPLGPVAPLDDGGRRAFLRDRLYVDGAGLSHTDGGVTRVSAADVAVLDWLPGTVAQLYRLPDGISLDETLTRVAIQDHAARSAKVHPGAVRVAPDLSCAFVGDTAHHVTVGLSGGVVAVSTRRAADGR